MPGWQHDRRSRHERGYGASWDRLRKQAMQRDNWLCQPCKREGRVTPARECDHITPKAKGGKDTLPNLQAICIPCHAAKSAKELAEEHRALREEGKPRVESDGWPVQPKRWGYSIPDGVRPSQAHVTIVCGPPASGKTTYVQSQAGKRDTIIDVDAIMQRLGGVAWSDDHSIIKQAMRYRDTMIRRLADRPNGKAWLIVAAPSRAERTAWLEALGPNASMHVMDTDTATCRQRILANPARRQSAGRQLEVLARWEP